MKYNNYTKMSHSLITTTNVIPFRNTTKSQDMKTIKNAMKKDNLQKTELINAIIADIVNILKIRVVLIWLILY